eukprot:354396-Chlamydomonas_euryale.AAC.5
MSALGHPSRVLRDIAVQIQTCVWSLPDIRAAQLEPSLEAARGWLGSRVQGYGLGCRFYPEHGTPSRACMLEAGSGGKIGQGMCIAEAFRLKRMRALTRHGEDACSD